MAAPHLCPWLTSNRIHNRIPRTGSHNWYILFLSHGMQWNPHTNARHFNYFCHRSSLSLGSSVQWDPSSSGKLLKSISILVINTIGENGCWERCRHRSACYGYYCIKQEFWHQYVLFKWTTGLAEQDINSYVHLASDEVYCSIHWSGCRPGCIIVNRANQDALRRCTLDRLKVCND